MEESHTLIAVDAGTTGVTCLLYDSALCPIQRAYREFPQHFPAEDRVEHHADQLLGAVDATLEEILTHPAAARALAIGVTNQRETVFALDRESGRVLGPGIVWQDRRTAARCRELAKAGHGRIVGQRTGLILDPYFSASKIEWMLREVPEVTSAARAGRVSFVTVDALIVHHLTRGSSLATEPTNASRTLLFDIERRAWDPELCALFGVDPDWLPKVQASAGDFGTFVHAGLPRPLPILGVVGDQQSALLGQGAQAPGEFKITYGTGCFLMLNAGSQRPVSVPGFLTTLALDATGATVFALEGSLFMGGAVIQWLRDGLGLFREAADSEALAAQVPDSGGVTLIPAFTGLGAPYWDPGARGALLGLNRGTTRAHVARAGLEGIAFQNAELVELLRKGTGRALDRILVDGGATQNRLLMQIQADLAGATMIRPRDLEATARGAALLAGLGAGLWPRMDRVPAPEQEAFRPRMAEPERQAALGAWRRAVERIRSNSGDSLSDA